MLRNTLILALLMFCAAGYTIYADRHFAPVPQQKEEKSLSFSKIPDFSFTDLDGKKHEIADFKGKAIILNFWASWCAPCVQEFPQMLELAAATKDNTVFLFLSIDEKEEDINRFLKKHIKTPVPSNVVIALDKDKHISGQLFQTFKIPETYLIDSNGYIKEKIIGFEKPWNSDSMIQKLKAL
jgi:thiol-disulfide isomerase/thioredoxin